MKKYDIDSEALTFKNPIYSKSGKNIVVAFDKCFNKDNINLNLFQIKKSAYSKNASMICRYANVFFKNYDTDNEFLTGLLHIKYQIDCKTSLYGLNTFVSDITEYLLSDTIIEKIFAMVDDYYSIDLTPNEEMKKIDMQSLQFLNEHGKELMALSVAYKLCIPVICHYYAIKHEQMEEELRIRNALAMSPKSDNEELEDDDITNTKSSGSMNLKEYLYNIFLGFFPLFQEDNNLFAKLSNTVISHLSSTRISDKVLWERLRNKKITPTIIVERLVSAVIVDLLPKAMFSGNLIYLIQVAIPKQINVILIGKDDCDYSEISMVSKDDELSGIEKLEATNAFVSDLDIVVGRLNIKHGIKKLMKKYKIEISKEEKEYYTKHLKSFVFCDIILQFFSKDFGGCCDLKSMKPKQYITLLIIFKKIMSRMGFVYLQEILTGNVSTSIKRRRVSTKQLKKIRSSYKFQKLMENYSDAIINDDDDNNPTLKTIAALINTPIEYVNYDHPKKLGRNIIADIDIVSDEYIRFVKML